MCALRAQPAKHRGAAFASNLITVLKNEYSLLVIDAPPCLSEPAVAFWLSQKFNPSEELLRMRSLANGKKDVVRISQNAKLTWESDASWDKQKYNKMMSKHFQGTKRIDTITEATDADEAPKAAYQYQTRKRVREVSM